MPIVRKITTAQESEVGSQESTVVPPIRKGKPLALSTHDAAALDAAPPAEAPLITVAELDARPPLAAVVAAMDASAPLPIALTLIDDNPYQPRLVYDDERIAAIAQSIAAHGLLQAPLGRPMPDGRVQLAFGHSRLRAYRQLAATDGGRFGAMPVLLRELDDETMALHAWIENRDRKDLTAYEEAKAIARYTTAFGWSQQQAAAKLQLSQPTIANKLRLLKLPPAALEQLRLGQLSERQALALLPLTELPAATLKKAESGYGYKPSQVIKQAASSSSDSIRQQVESIVRNATVELRVDWKEFDFGALAGIESPRCADCALRSNGRCAGPACFDVKRQAWTQRRLDQAAKKFGIPALAKEPGHHESEKFYSGEDLGKQILTAGCDKLRIHPGYGGLDLKGFPDLHAICLHGAGKKCSCLMKARAQAAKTDPAKIQEREHKKQIAELKARASNQLADAIAAQERGAWLEVLRALDYEYRKAEGSSATLESIIKGIAAKLISNAMPYGSDKPEAVRTALEKLFQRCGMPAPWSEPPADHLRANTSAAPGQAPRLPIVVTNDPQLTPIVAGIKELEEWIAEEGVAEDEEIRVALVDATAIRKDLEALADAPDVGDAVYEALLERLGSVERALREQLQEDEVGG